jgi:hypothetical protein
MNSGIGFCVAFLIGIFFRGYTCTAAIEGHKWHSFYPAGSKLLKDLEKGRRFVLAP